MMPLVVKVSITTNLENAVCVLFMCCMIAKLLLPLVFLSMSQPPED